MSLRERKKIQTLSRSLILSLLGALVLSGASAQDLGTKVPGWVLDRNPLVIRSGEPFEVSVTVTIPPGYYQDAASPFFLWEPQGPVQVVDRRADPTPHRVDGKEVFTGTVVLHRTLLVPDIEGLSAPELVWKTGWQICEPGGVCLLPGAGTLRSAAILDRSPGLGFWGALLGAFVGGLILNLMPCVFPVLALKGLGLASTVGMTRSARRKDALAFAAGGFSALTLLGMVTALVAALGQHLEWGFAFQQPAFVLVLALAFWALGLQLWGVWTWKGTPFSLSSGFRPTLSKAFFGGAFLVVTAAPCTAPFLGPALGFAFTQPPWTIPFFFCAAGAGLVLPLLVLQWLPGWGRFLPKPGRWMVGVERTAGLALGATSAYLLWIFTRQSAPDLGWPLVMVFFAVSAALVAARRAGATFTAQGTAAVLLAAALEGSVLLLAPGTSKTTAPVTQGPGWTVFSLQSLERARDSGSPVLVDATADWCATCQVNEWAVLDRSDVQRILDQNGVVRIRADYTRPDPEIRRWLISVGRAGLPVYALYRPGKPVYLFPELLTDSNFTKVLPRLVQPSLVH